MRHQPIRVHALVLFMLMIALPGVRAVYQVGQHVGDFSLPDSQGTLHSLSDYSGQVVWINFWTSG
jgi:hypothetical protein